MTISYRASDKTILYIFIGFLFFLSILPIASTIFLVAAILFWAVNSGWRASFATIRQNRIWWIIIAYYVFHVISLLWSENLKYAFFDLQVKLAFLICPLLAAGLSFSEDAWKKLRAAFIAGTTLSSLICIGYAALLFFENGSTENFFYNKLSVLMHPTYFVIYLGLSILFIFYDLFFARESKIMLRRIYYLVMFFQLLVIFLLSARTAIAAFMLVLIIYSVLLWRQKKILKKDTLPVILFFLCAVILQLGALSFFNRYEQVTEVIRDPGTTEENSTSIRYNLWRIAVDLISEHPVAGVGIGDIKEELVKKYEEHQYEYGIIHRISPHSQYLHTAVILGLTGVFLLVYMLAGAFLLAWKNADWIYLLFVVMIAMNGITESLLERQGGILFFAFFNSMFAARLTGAGKESIQ